MKRNFFLIFFAAVLALAKPAALLATYFGQVETGLQLVRENNKTGYFLYLPASFETGKKWPLILAFAEWGPEKKKAFAEQWSAEAEKRGYVVLCPDWWRSRGEVPEQGDKMVFKILEKVKRSHNIDASRILLTGFGDGADYAFYLALRYPDRFSAVAPVGGGITPIYENMISYRKVRGAPLPFLIINGKQDVGLQDRHLTLEAVRSGAEKLRQAGLSVELKEIDGLGHEYKRNFNQIILDWFEGTKGK